MYLRDVVGEEREGGSEMGSKEEGEREGGREEVNWRQTVREAIKVERRC